MNFQEVINAEKDVWEIVYEPQEFSQGTAFFTQDFPAFPHWNLFYSKDLKRVFSSEELTQINEAYKKRDCVAHLLTTCPEYKNHQISFDTYYFKELDVTSDKEIIKKINKLIPEGIKDVENKIVNASLESNDW